MMRTLQAFPWVIASLGAAVLVVACGGGDPSRGEGASEAAVVQPPVDKGSAPWELYLDRERASGSGSYQVSYVPSPDPIPLNEIFDLDLDIRPLREGVPSPEELTVNVHGDMPVHNHGMNTQAIVTPMGDGAYRVEGMLFHMAGHWRILVDLVRGDGRLEVAAFDVVVD